jgi:hypothetical protein
MQFRLTYEGPLFATQRDAIGGQSDPKAQHKQHLRREFHRQLKYLWSAHPWLRDVRMINPKNLSDSDNKRYMHEVLADRYKMFGYRFVPLVRHEISLLCTIDVLFLRREIPGSVISSGDIDNRIKTVFDALRPPGNQQELKGSEHPGDGEDPFFVLMENDDLISHASIETDMLLDPPEPGNKDANKARLVITVTIHPYAVTMFNLGFA